MKKFSVKWYEGSITHIDNVLKEKQVKAESIDDVNCLTILPKDVKSKVLYTRAIMSTNKTRNIDYGSWSRFIEVEEIGE